MLHLNREMLVGACALGGSAAAHADNAFDQTNLVSDLPNVARFQDADLVNPWGAVFIGGDDIQIADNGSGKSTRYELDGRREACREVLGDPLVERPGVLGEERHHTDHALILRLSAPGR